MRQLAFFGWLYFVQGAALAYVVNFQKPYLAGQGVSKETIGLFTSLLLLPFIFKIFLGMLSDRWPLGRMGRRKPYMLVGLGAFSICYMSLVGISPATNFAGFAAVTWLASLGLALFDTCADGLAVDVVSERKYGAVQASMIAGKSLGLILMSFLFGNLVSEGGVAAVFATLSALSVAVLIPVAISSTRGAEPPDRSGTGSGAPNIFANGTWNRLMNRSYLAFAALGVIYSVSSFGTDGLLTLHLTEARGLEAVQIGVYGMMRGMGGLCGAIGYAVASRRFGLERTQYASLLMLGAGALLPLANWNFAISGAIWGLCWGFQETAFVTLAMRYAHGAWAATLFAISMIYSNLGTSVGEALASPLVPRLGYGGVFGSFAFLAWACLALVPSAFRGISPRADRVSERD